MTKPLNAEQVEQLAAGYHQLIANLKQQRVTLAEILYCCLKHLDPPEPSPYGGWQEVRDRQRKRREHKAELVAMLPDVILMLDPEHDLRRAATRKIGGK